MQTWPLRPPSAPAAMPSTVELPEGAGDVVAGLIDAIGERDFSDRLLHHVNRVTPAGAVSAYILARDAAPELVATATTERPDRTREVWEAYRGSLYRQDRSFDPAWRSPSALMSRCTKSTFAPAHQRRVYEPLKSHERLSVAMALDATRLLAVNLYRNLGQPGFDEDDARRVARIAMPLLACVRRQARWLAAAEPAPVALRERLRARCPRLTERELDVLEHLARGCTYDGAAAACGVSPATVKTYRERAFLKLGIHFRSELTALLIEPAAPGLQQQPSGFGGCSRS